jgi:ligand-binding sensor domain-containing protein
MKLRLTISSFFILLFLIKVLPIFSQQIIFNKVLPPEGNSFGIVTGIAQDINGYMWFATQNGAYSYNGYHFTSYIHNSLNTNSLVATYVECIYAEKNGIIWFGTGAAGLDRFDPETGVFTHFKHNVNDPNSISNNKVTAILRDKQGILWIGTHGGLNMFDSTTNTFIHYQHNESDSTSISNNQVRAIYEDRQGTIWIGTGTPFSNEWDGPEEGGLNRLNKKTGTFTHYLHDAKNIHSLSNNKVRAIYEDTQGAFWIGTAADVLHKMDRQKGTFERIVNDPAHPEKLSGPPLTKEAPAYEHIAFINQDAAGSYWIGSLFGGINYYNPKIGKTIHFSATENSSAGFNDPGAWSAFTSRDGILWISNWNGNNLYKIDPFHKEIPHYSSSSFVNCFYEDPTGVLWTGTEKELIRNEIKKGIVKRYKIDPLGNPNVIQTITEDRQGNIWVGGGGGLNLWDKEKESFINYKYNPTNKNSLSCNNISIVHEDQESNLWIGTYCGFNLLNRKTNSFTRYYINPNDTAEWGENMISAILRDKTNKLWIGTWLRGGVHLFNLENNTFKKYLTGITVSCLFEDADGVLWLGSDDGLYKFDRNADVFSRYKDSNSITDISFVSSMVEDNQKNLWLQTPDGLMRLNPQRNETRIYDKNFGVGKNTFRFTTCYKGRDGKLFFIDLTGYHSFYPAEFIQSSKPPEIIFTGFRLAGQLVKPGNKGPLKGNLLQTEEIELLYNQDVFSFNFAAIDYANPEDNRHFFMLENYDDSWRPAGSVLLANYFNIPPGKYVFRVKASNSRGVWAEKKINIIILPPWWRTWWAYCIYGLLLFAMVFAAYRFQKRRIVLAERRRTHQLRKEKQLAELQRQKTELEMQTLRAQMNPHFIFNSLNSINRFILQNERAQASEYLTKFSKLIRMILQNSQASLITLDSELESLDLYLNLEALRFNYHFDYKISVPKDLDVSALHVPPLILQPFVENAIWHGLMHKEEKGQLDIEISEEDKHLYFKITDNGIGRKKASELASKSATKHKSMGLRITAHRITMLQNAETLESPVTINDLVNADGSAAGTEVVIKMPLIYD